MKTLSTLKTFGKVLFAALPLAVSMPAFAAGEGFTEKVGRDYHVDNKTGDNIAVAIGDRTHAGINNGGMSLQSTSVDIGRDYTVNNQTGDNIAVAIGSDSTAYINNGGIYSHQH